MNYENPANQFYIPRDTGERRVSAQCPPPYLAEDGFILFDRREQEPRRHETHHSQIQQS